MKKTQSELRIDAINAAVRSSVSYIKSLEDNVESAYSLWLSMNKYTADEAEITNKRVESINKKLEYQKQMINLTKKAYEDIKSLAGSFADDTISAQTRYLETVNAYQNMMAKGNLAISEYNEAEMKRVQKENKAIDKENKKKFGFTAETVDDSDFTYVKDIIEKYRQYIKENKDTYLEVGGNLEDFMKLAKSVTGYDKIEEQYKNGKTGGIPDLIPYVEAKTYQFPEIEGINYDQMDTSTVENAVKNNFRNIANGTQVVISKAFNEMGEQGIKDFADGLNSGVIKYETMLASFADSFSEKLKSEIDKSLEKEFITNNYTSNYTINTNSKSAEAELEDFERYEELKKFRKAT